MLAYNFRKYTSKLDPVREILAKIDAKQSKTGLSLYNQHHSPSPAASHQGRTVGLSGTSPKQHEDEQKMFPNIKAARKKAQDRITVGELDNQDDYSTKRQKRTKKIPHRLPEVTSQAFHPVSHSIDRHDDRINQSAYTIPDTQYDRDKIDININPFGYNRKTLAFDERNINYVVEWPETWPFKIMSFQGKSKQTKRKPKRIQRPKDPVLSPPSFPHHDNQTFPWKEPTSHPARVLAPVDHPVKPPVYPTRPFVESAVKRGSRKKCSKKELRKVVLKSQERDFNFSAQSGDRLGGEDTEFTELGNRMGLHAPDSEEEEEEEEGESNNQKNSQRKTENERVDSVPPSTPVPDGHPSEKDTNEPAEDDGKDEVHQEANEVLNDIVNQIISEDKPYI